MVDLSNLYYCVKTKFGRRLDLKKFLDQATEKFPNYRAIAYGAEIAANPIHSFKSVLVRIGFELRFKAAKIYKTQGKEFRKADWDVGIAVDIIEMIDEYDVLILGSADGDMVPCIEYIKKRGKQCFVLAAGISKDLQDSVDGSTEITENLLERHQI